MESSKTEKECLKDEQKVIVKFLTLTDDLRPTIIRDRLQFVYKENTETIETIQQWIKQFRGLKNLRRIRKKKINPSLKLHSCEDPWRRIEIPDGSEEKTAEIVPKKLFGVLNKLTEKNFGSLMKQVECLPINTEECLRKAVKVIISYVCNEHKFSNLYAKLCEHISTKAVPFEKQIIGACPMSLGFGEVLRTSCEEELRLKLKEIESVPFESSNRLRYQLKGLNLFIAELYLLQVLSVQCLHDEYLQLLIDDTDNIYKAENLCISLSKLGKFLEVQSIKTPPKFLKEHLDSYFAKINNHIENKSKLPIRIYFVILDLVELRNRDWIPRVEPTIEVRFVRKYRFMQHQKNANDNYTKTKNIYKKKKNIKQKDENRSEKKESSWRDECKNHKEPYPNIIKGAVKDEMSENVYKVRGSMNKMTDKNFVCILEKLLAIPIESYTSEIVKLIVDKSIKEPLYCHLYAELCRNLCLKLPVENTNQEGQNSPSVSFKILLLTECDKSWKEKIEEGNILRDIEDDLLFKYKTMSKGLAKFVAELYKLGIISNDTINKYIQLLSDESNQSLRNIEFTCYFLTYIGEELEKENKEIFEKLFTSIKLLYEKEPKYPKRICFMLLDLLELKNNNWLSKPSVIDDSESENIKIIPPLFPKGIRFRGKNKPTAADSKKPAATHNNRTARRKSKNRNSNANQNASQSCDVAGLGITVSKLNI